MALFGALPRNSASLRSGNLDKLESELRGLPLKLFDLLLVRERFRLVVANLAENNGASWRDRSSPTK
jgi:hypothetical protein